MAAPRSMFQQFHQAIIDGCGNATLGSSSARWRACGRSTRRRGRTSPPPPGVKPIPHLRASVVAAHEEITDAIEAGDASRAQHLVAAHLAKVAPLILGHGAPPIDVTGANRA